MASAPNTPTVRFERVEMIAARQRRRSDQPVLSPIAGALSRREAARRGLAGRRGRRGRLMLRLAFGMLALGTGALLLVPVVFGAASGASAVGNPVAAGASCTVADTGAASTPLTVNGVDLSPDQMHNAQVIVAVVKARKLAPAAAQIALMTAMQESAMTVVDHGDAAGPDSRGLFQQRDSWGPLSVRMDPAGSTGLFLDRLVTVPGWATIGPGHVGASRAAQRQRRGLPQVGADVAGARAARCSPTIRRKVTCTGGTLLPGAAPECARRRRAQGRGDDARQAVLLRRRRLARPDARRRRRGLPGRDGGLRLLGARPLRLGAGRRSTCRTTPATSTSVAARCRSPRCDRVISSSSPTRARASITSR